MEKTTPQCKLQAMNSTSDKAGDSSLDGIVDSSAASVNVKTVREEKCVENNTVGSEMSIEDHDHCKGMFFPMSFGGESLNPFPTYLMRDTVLHDFVLKRCSSSLAQHMPIKLISPIFIDSADDYIHGDQRDTIGPHLDVDEMNPHEDEGQWYLFGLHVYSHQQNR